MSLVAFFVQECSTCGRTLEIRVELLGKEVFCQHCGAKFLAQDRDRQAAEAPDTESLLRRAERLIADSQRPPERWGLQRTP